MKIMDMLSTAAGIGLISMAATMAVANGAANVECPELNVKLLGGSYTILAWTCPPGTECGIEVRVTTSGQVKTVIGICVANAPPPGGVE